ncbi:hypothetical protein QZH41_015380, partial [Actinostola sp. cb2023]
CKEPLGIETSQLPDSSMSATSWYDLDHEPWLGRLYETRGENAWCAKTNDGNQYLQLDLGHVTRVMGVATQGKYRYSWWTTIKEHAWVTAYKMSSSNDTFVWGFYKGDGVTDKVFTGNSASRDVIKHNLTKEMVTRHVRFIPTTWETWTCLRVEVYGCKGNTTVVDRNFLYDSPLGMEFFHIKREAILESTGHTDNRFQASNARLNQIDQYAGWTPHKSAENPFLQIDVGSERALVTAVATQGYHTNYNVVYKFTLSFSNDLLDWFDYIDVWETKV